ncbi:type I polyketide synthase [Dolichospermum sp. UHCC 0684]|uniref:type I polyketide synthase n=1 Tax=unclassified Dolichospermum TaxID=2622029 RepID=UPI00144869C4|nr:MULTISPECIES: type I polyketide synthase [unclassified Dolichospermum]MEA5529504.1 type I polyketide synthase [Dolichospermum sp. UHCC 0684]MTJ36275.1 SDR family NAD(P)-dependent oxidoreductase [Dolichospermum sp. UHCC 0260]
MTQHTDFFNQFRSLSSESQFSFWTNFIQTEISSILGFAPSHPLDITRGFFEMEMTSLMVIELQDRLQKALENLIVLPSSLVFDYPSIKYLAEYLVTNISTSETIKRSVEQCIPLLQKSDIKKSSKLEEPEAIAIIGIGCRFPGEANSPEAFWSLIQNGIDAISEIPGDRWDIANYYDNNPDIPGKMYTNRGGYLNAIAQFDPEFFGIAPREAISLDPQQRILLEVGWEALEHGGQAPEKLMSSQTGVFIGLINADYAKLQIQTGDSTRFNAYYGTGTALSAAAGRLSYFLGLQGPAIVVDTACSSSLVTIHLACQSLRTGECNLALAGGCNLIISPDSHIFLSQAKAISSDGRCKTFDASADGYGRGEGCGIVVLKRLSQAVADGDKIFAVIRGSAVNHDGHTSGFTVPNGLSQETLLQTALDSAGIKPHEVDYIEAHGTGTPLGDPIEVRALGSVFSQGRTRENPLKIGSVKTNIGHLESAAGIAGLIKVVLALHHQEIPPHLHLQTLNPRIVLEESYLQIPTKRTPWLRTTVPRVAGVSSFGLSGTNAHILLAEAPEVLPPTPHEVIERPLHLLTLSAKTEPALIQLVQRYQQYLTNHGDAEIADICYTANTGRSHFSERLAVVAESTSELQARLTELLEKHLTSSPIYSSVQYSVSPKISFTFSGSGVFHDMGYQLYQTQPKFHQALELCSQHLQPFLDQSLADILYSQEIENSLKPFVIFAVEYALSQMWQSWGIEPKVVVGFGVGELVGACIAGVITLEDSLSLLLEQKFPPLSPDESVTQIIQLSAPRISLISGMTGKPLSDENIFSHEYWCQCLQSLVEPSEVLFSDQCNLWISLDYAEKQETAVWFPSLKPDQSDWQTISQLLTKLYLHGLNINWSGFDRGYLRHLLVLPTYPFQRQEYWLSPQLETQISQSITISHSPLIRRLHSPLTEVIQFESQFSLDTLPFLADHQVYGVIVIPATLYLAMIIAAAIEMGEKASGIIIEDVAFLKALSLAESGLCTLQLILKPESPEKTVFQVFSLDHQSSAEGGNWQLHITGTLRLNADEILQQTQNSPDEIQHRCLKNSSGEELLYQNAADRGLHLGTSFRWIKSVWHRQGEAIGQVQTPSGLVNIPAYPLHPGLIDACLQMLNATLPTKTWDGTAYVPIKIDYLKLISLPCSHEGLWAYVLLNSPDLLDAKTLAGDIQLLDDSGQVYIEVGNFTVKQVEQKLLLPTKPSSVDDWLYQLKWRSLIATKTQKLVVPGQWLIFADAGGVGQALATLLGKQGQKCTLVYPVNSDVPSGNSQIQINPERSDEFVSLWQQISQDTLPILGVIHLWSLDANLVSERTSTTLIANQTLICGSALYLIQTLIKESKSTIPQLQFVTQGAQAVTPQDIVAVDQSPLWGMVRTLSFEHPELNWGITDLQPLNPENQAVSIFTELMVTEREEYVAYRVDSRYVARLTKYPDRIVPNTNYKLNPDATYLITGGLGDLGLEVAQWMIDQGATSLVLISRRGRDLTDERMDKIDQSSAKVLVAQADVSNYEELEKIFLQIGDSLPPLKGIIHAAGVLKDGVLIQQQWQRFTQVMMPKIGGAWNLHLLTQKISLDFFILFSSAASLVGSAGQSNYAAGNAFLDTLAHYRRSQGLPGLSINWGPWADVGMAARDQRTQGRWDAEGIGQIPAKQGLQILQHCLQTPDAHLGVLPIEWSKFIQSFANGKIPRLFTELVTDSLTTQKPQSQVLQQLENLPHDRRWNFLKEYLTSEVKLVLGLPVSHNLKLQKGLFEMGIDSLMAVDLKNRLQNNLEKTLPATIIFDYPTIESLIRYIGQKVMGWSKDKNDPKEQSKEQPIYDQPLEGASTNLEQISDDEVSDLLAAEMAAVAELMGGNW